MRLNRQSAARNWSGGSGKSERDQRDQRDHHDHGQRMVFHRTPILWHVFGSLGDISNIYIYIIYIYIYQHIYIYINIICSDLLKDFYVDMENTSALKLTVTPQTSKPKVLRLRRHRMAMDGHQTDIWLVVEDSSNPNQRPFGSDWRSFGEDLGVNMAELGGWGWAKKDLYPP